MAGRFLFVALCQIIILRTSDYRFVLSSIRSNLNTEGKTALFRKGKEASCKIILYERPDLWSGEYSLLKLLRERIQVLLQISMPL